MEKPITTADIVKRPRPVEPIPIQRPITTAQIGDRVPVNGKMVKNPPILTLADMEKNRRRVAQYRALPWDLRPHPPKPAPKPRQYVWLPSVGNLWDVLPRGAWTGRRCFIVGGGPSLRSFDWSLLDGELSIGINRAFERYTPTMMFCMDPRVWGWIVRGDFGEESTRRYEEFSGLKVWMYASNFVFPDNIYTVRYAEVEPNGNNSGHAAINLAILLGAKEIYLLGFDMHGDHKGNQKWFHNGYPQLQSEGVYKDYIEALTDDAARIKSAGVRVVNLSPDSALRCFPFDIIDNIVTARRKIVRPIVISYYTEGTSYEEEAERLKQSLDRFCYEYDIVPKPSLGSWKKNTYYKATFIREMMDKHPDRNLLWIDADGAMIHYPSLFDDVKEDFGVFIADWDKIGGYKRRLSHPDSKIVRGKELLSGTLYIANNERARALVDAWIAMNKRNFAVKGMEQENLQIVLNSWSEPLSILELPPSYCQIWDTMAYLGEPVIEHYQAARRIKHEVDH